MKPKNLVSTTELLNAAVIGNYGIGGIEAWDQTSLKAAIDAAVETNSPLQVLVGGPEVETIGIKAFTQMAYGYIAESSVPIALHLDECTDVDTIKKCMQAGFSSVMFDGAELDFAENVKITKEIVEIAHASGISVEASLGEMPYSVKGTTELENSDDMSSYLTNVDQAIEFVAKTQIDVLAPSVGNIHALYSATMPEPNLELSKELYESTKRPLSMHGSSGASDEQVRQMITAGFKKINIGTRLMEIYRSTMRTGIDKHEGYPCAFKILQECRLAMKDEVKRLIIEVYRSNNKIK